MTTAMSRSDTCHCGPGHVEWKWECHPVAGLGDPCITSAQCHNHQVTIYDHDDACVNHASPQTSSSILTNTRLWEQFAKKCL